MPAINETEERIEAEAADWVVLLASGRAESSDIERLETWRRQSSAHEEAFQLARRTWRDFELLRGSAATREARTTRRAHVPRLRGWHALAASVLLAIGLGLAYAVDPVTLVLADHRTGVGETSEVVLPDGSIVHLNTRSAIAVRFDGRERRVDLLDGEAAFQVARQPEGDSARPFVVAAADGEARALGTRYVVHRLDEAVQVTVVEHKVEVSRKAGSAAPASMVVVEAGEAVRYGEAGLGPVRPADLRTAASWQRGRLVFDQVPLSAVARELNRYRHGAILIADDTLASRTVSGVFRLDDLAAAVDRIAAELDARIVDVSPLLTILY